MPETSSLDPFGRFRNGELQTEYLLHCMQKRSKISFAIVAFLFLVWSFTETLAFKLSNDNGNIGGWNSKVLGLFAAVSFLLTFLAIIILIVLCLSYFTPNKYQHIYSYCQVSFIVMINLIYIVKILRYLYIGTPNCLQYNIPQLITDNLPSNVSASDLDVLKHLLSIAHLPPTCPSERSFLSNASYQVVIMMSFCPQLIMAILYEPRLYLILAFHLLTSVLVCFSIRSSLYWLLPMLLTFIVLWFLLAELHFQRVQGFLNQRKIRQLLEENERNADANHAMELRSMIGNVAHDLKTPLASFTSGLDVIKDILMTAQEKAKAQSSSPHNKGAASIIDGYNDSFASINSCLTNIRNTNAFMLMTINRCIDYTKASKGMKLVPKYETVDLREALQFPIECMNNIQERIKIQLLPLNDDICSHIITDKQWLQENLLCLLSNAVKYSAEGNVTIKGTLVKSITTTTGCVPPINNNNNLLKREISIFSTQSSINTNKILPGSNEDTELLDSAISETSRPPSAAPSPVMLHFEIEDTGIGLSEDAMKNLFNPFKQAQRLAGGTGLGLYSLAKRIEAMKGSYGVQNRRDGKKGSLFWFAIPYKPDNTLSVAASSLLDSPAWSTINGRGNDNTSPNDGTGGAGLGGRKGLEILLVDDSPSILKMSSMMLKRQGHKIRTAENGEIALKRIEEKWISSGKGFDLVLMDLQMPVMDGLEATRRLRKMELEGRDWMETTVINDFSKSNDNDNDNDDNKVHPIVPCHQLIFGVSANSDHETMNDAYAAGVDDFFGKPFSLTTFNQTIERFFKL